MLKRSKAYVTPKITPPASGMLSRPAISAAGIAQDVMYSAVQATIAPIVNPSPITGNEAAAMLWIVYLLFIFSCTYEVINESLNAVYLAIDLILDVYCNIYDNNMRVITLKKKNIYEVRSLWKNYVARNDVISENSNK